MNKSKCCNAEVKETCGEDFGNDDDIRTCWNECTKCNKPCDIQPSKEEEKVAKVFSEMISRSRDTAKKLDEIRNKIEYSTQKSKFLEINGVAMNVEGYTDQQIDQVKEFADILLTTAIEEERKKNAEIVRSHKIRSPKTIEVAWGIDLTNNTLNQIEQKILNPNSNNQNEI